MVSSIQLSVRRADAIRVGDRLVTHYRVSDPSRGAGSPPVGLIRHVEERGPGGSVSSEWWAYAGTTLASRRFLGAFRDGADGRRSGREDAVEAVGRSL